jgi:uncharacterized protein (TIGR02145 family)
MGKASPITPILGLILNSICLLLQGQVVPAFIAPDSTCVGANVLITNNTTGGSTYYWNFCSGNAGSNPSGINIGNPGNNLNFPVYMTLVKDGPDCFSFVSNQGLPTHITRNFHGTSFKNNPVSSVSLLETGIIDHYTEAIQIKQDNGNWYGFLNNNSTILRLDFGNSLWNIPTPVDIGPFPGTSVAHGLGIIKEGNTWLGFFDSDLQNKLYRLNFGLSLANSPSIEDLGNLAGFNHPCQLAIIKENSQNYILVVNFDNNTLSRISFGNSLLNIPTGQNLGNCGAIVSPCGITALHDCETSTGYYTVYQPVPGAAIGRLTFSGGVAGTVSAQSLGNIGGLGRPVSFSEIFRQNDTLYAYVPNRDNSSLTRFSFPPCNNASIPSSTQYNPPPFSYNLPGTYNIRLVVNEGQPDEATLCKSIFVGPVPSVELGPDHFICQGTSTLLNAGGGFSSYLWSTGATTQSIVVSNPGKYWVNATKYGCVASDTIRVFLYPVSPLDIGRDTVICEGTTYTFDAGSCPGCSYIWSNLTTQQMNIGTGPVYTTGTEGTYMVTRTDAYNCIKSDTATLSVALLPVNTTSPMEKIICSGDSTKIFLTSTIPNSTFNWTASLTSGNISGFSADSGMVINQVLVNHDLLPGVVTYHITPKFGRCTGASSDFTVTINPSKTVSVSISASANNVCTGTEVTFTATSMNGGSNPHYLWKVNGFNVGSNSPGYTYIPANGDFIRCVLTSSESCTTGNPASSNQIQMVAIDYLQVYVSITASSNPFCAGTFVTFTAAPTNGGLSPHYQWKVNGNNAGTDNPVYTYIPNDGDMVSCTLISSEPCTANNPATSAEIMMVADDSFTAGVSITANPNPFCPGATVIFTAFPVNGGGSPSYQWKVNGNSTGGNSPVLSYAPQAGDSIRCFMTSNLSCVTSNPATSNTIIMTSSPVPIVTFTRCFDSITRINAKPIKLKGGIPLGGTYSGPGVNSITGVFTPSTAGTGTKIITYSYTNSYFCTSSSSLSIINRPLSILTCGNNLIDIRDNKVYPTVKIGSQCWMAADLNYGKEISADLYQRDNCTPEKYKAAVGSQQTAYYLWDEIMQYSDCPGVQGFCPPAWHIPTEAEWNTLFANWTNNAFAGMALKYSGFSGFNALLSGVRHMTVEWNWHDLATFFWSSTPHSATKAWSHGMNDYDPGVAVYPALRTNAFSVRCIRDQ